MTMVIYIAVALVCSTLSALLLGVNFFDSFIFWVAVMGIGSLFSTTPSRGSSDFTLPPVIKTGALAYTGYKIGKWMAKK